MPGPSCLVCTSPRRSEIDLDLTQGMPTTKVAAKYGEKQYNVARHKRLHLKPHLLAIGRVIGSASVLSPLSPANTAALIPTVGTLLGKFGTTIEKLERLVDDAEKDGGIAVRAVSLRELRTGLTDATKIIATLAPPPAAPIENINRGALAGLFSEVHDDDKSEILDKLLPSR